MVAVRCQSFMYLLIHYLTSLFVSVAVGKIGIYVIRQTLYIHFDMGEKKTTKKTLKH